MLACDGATSSGGERCAHPVTHVDEDGWLYCAAHGEQRKQHKRCRKLRPHELRKLERGEKIRY